MTEPTTAVAIREDAPLSILEIAGQIQLIQDALGTVMIQGVHYGQLENDQGVARLKKPILYKAGSEKLCQLFKLRPRYDELASVHQQEFVAYRHRCVLIHYPSGLEVGEGVGSCNSRERKYRRAEPWDIDNTILKMSSKRALAAAVLSATAASDIFDQSEAPVQVGQHRKLAMLIKQLEEEQPGGPDGDGWEAWTRRQAHEMAGVESRAELTAEEMSELIEVTTAELRTLAEGAAPGATTPAAPAANVDGEEDIPFGDPAEPIDASHPSALIVDFGKYRDMSLGEIERQDPGYVSWLADKGQNAAVKEAATAMVAAR